ncbi:MAG TPA: EAL domain-containing protein [Sphingomonas sp.]|nr:EAL domain-containing protein [Sphingomonas sp.]
MNSVSVSPSKAMPSVLIVDDNPANLGVVVDLLEGEGYVVLVALGGEEALKRADFALPDLILLDVMMPQMDGFETCRRLKARPRTWEIPVIFMTALSDVADKIAAFAAGGVDYINKPFQSGELLARVKTHLQLRQAQVTLATHNQVLEREIAARRQVEQALRASELSYRRLFETADDGMLLLDIDTALICDANPRFLAMLGCDLDAVTGRKLEDLPAFAAVPTAAAAAAALQATGSIRHDDWSLVAADGTSIAVEVVGSLCEAGDGRLAQCNFRDITERKQAEARIRYLALHDGMTGLPNRTMFLERLGVATAKARRENSRIGVLLLDVDHFKQINDSLGHVIGDQLLEAVAGRLTDCLRESDIAARLGGDEFVIALSDVESADEAESVAAKVLAAMNTPFVIEGQTLAVSVSIGICLYPDDGDSAGTLLSAADTAMYRAKRSGRNACRLFTHDLSIAAERWHALAQDVRGACDRGEYVLHYQPQVSLDERTLIGMETLLRWEHPTEGLISPGLFIPLLEERGMMVEVGRWVLNTACRQNAQWQAAGMPPVRIAVNLSAQQFYRGDIVRITAEALAASGLDPQWLELELTESLTLDDTEETVRIMNDLKALGVSLSLDDFGTGWSSLAYLRRFPLDRIKIDRTFVRDLTSHESTAAIVHSILDLTRRLGLDCIAEGVETEEQRAILLRDFCPSMQGFLFSAALTTEQMTSLFETLLEGGRAIGQARQIEDMSAAA